MKPLRVLFYLLAALGFGLVAIDALRAMRGLTPLLDQVVVAIAIGVSTIDALQRALAAAFPNEVRR